MGSIKDNKYNTFWINRKGNEYYSRINPDDAECFKKELKQLMDKNVIE